ncbi:hypothetical protein AMAG_08052 [Allomyces macrogynus ATCC 38327]|uniref:Uncharacterized protein n=1 Tax=Allomyces macrogynus (strain ATCC 38327) TaxID=578462 RepID=A0A0L0SKE2_ALLM3|nr:hypothetical protein AMAG_08052 [Allomyces macrogynus ATCC 38327]|eukprot:KNE62875.1 hypothetical protein AMAG_08052 [Allomyces macrogynus ATCC 38327]
MHGTYPASQAQPAAAGINPTYMPVHPPHAHAHAHAHPHAPRAPPQHAVAQHHGQYTYAGGPWPPRPPHAVNPASYPPVPAGTPPQGPPLAAVPYAPIEPHARHATGHSAGAPPTWSPPGHENPRTAVAPGPHHETQPWPARDMDARLPPPPPPPSHAGRWVFEGPWKKGKG